MAKNPSPEVESEIEQPRPPLPPIAVSPIPQIEVVKETPIEKLEQPHDFEYTGGIYIKQSDGLEYATCVREPDAYENTHFAKNSAHSWRGKETEFKLQFDRK